MLIKKRVGQSKDQFDLTIHSDRKEHIEFWYARDLMPLLGYERWKNFAKAIDRAIESCETGGVEVRDHFREVTKMITVLIKHKLIAISLLLVKKQEHFESCSKKFFSFF